MIPQKTYQYALAHALVRFLWEPREGDSVSLRNSPDRRKYKIKSIGPAEIYLDNDAGPYLPRQLLYRVTPDATRSVWERLRTLCTYSTEVSPGKWIAGIKVNRSTMVLQGKTVRIVAQLLELRGIDIRINDGVNRIVNNVKESGALRLVYSAPEESHPA
jgi:hypothetical protein